jgi:hypothetical protein
MRKSPLLTNQSAFINFREVLRKLKRVDKETFQMGNFYITFEELGVEKDDITAMGNLFVRKNLCGIIPKGEGKFLVAPVEVYFFLQVIEKVMKDKNAGYFLVYAYKLFVQFSPLDKCSLEDFVDNPAECFKYLYMMVRDQRVEMKQKTLVTLTNDEIRRCPQLVADELLKNYYSRIYQ